MVMPSVVPVFLLYPLKFFLKFLGFLNPSFKKGLSRRRHALLFNVFVKD